MPRENSESSSIAMPPDFIFRIRSNTYEAEIIKDIGLTAREEEGALEEIAKLFSAGNFSGREGVFFLVKSVWNAPIKKGEFPVVKEAPLIIMDVTKYQWIAMKGGDYIKTS